VERGQKQSCSRGPSNTSNRRKEGPTKSRLANPGRALQFTFFKGRKNSCGGGRRDRLRKDGDFIRNHLHSENQIGESERPSIDRLGRERGRKKGRENWNGRRGTHTGGSGEVLTAPVKGTPSRRKGGGKRPNSTVSPGPDTREVSSKANL